MATYSFFHYVIRSRRVSQKDTQKKRNTIERSEKNAHLAYLSNFRLECTPTSSSNVAVEMGWDWERIRIHLLFFSASRFAAGFLTRWANSRREKNYVEIKRRNSLCRRRTKRDQKKGFWNCLMTSVTVCPLRCVLFCWGWERVLTFSRISLLRYYYYTWQSKERFSGERKFN